MSSRVSSVVLAGMMLLALPLATSADTVALGVRVTTTSNLNVHQSANINGKLLCVQPAGATGTITGGPTVQGAYTWWQVDFDSGCDGWVVQTYITSGAVLGATTSLPTGSFALGSQVNTIANLNVRSKADTRRGSKIKCTQLAGTLGTIIGGPTNASGYNWWNINYNTGCDGWSVQDYLTPFASGSLTAAPPPTLIPPPPIAPPPTPSVSSVVNYGAVSSSCSDAAAITANNHAIQAALDSGPSVYFPPGNYPLVHSTTQRIIE
jgi:uncharacterized protein YgiM (DUF1202 family)